MRGVCVCVWKKSKNVHAIFYSSSPFMYKDARKHVLAHASKALLICYLCEEVPTILANNVWMCAMKYQVRSKRKNYYSSSANNDELYYDTRSHHWDLTRLGMMIAVVVCRLFHEHFCTNWLDDTFGDSPEGNLKVSIDENNASLAVRINLPSSSSFRLQFGSR